MFHQEASVETIKLIKSKCFFLYEQQFLNVAF